MAHREWNNLNTANSYTISAGNGWTLVMNSDGTVTLRHGGGASAKAAALTTDMTINPDPGDGQRVPPSK